MRFMMLMYPGPKAEAGVMPDDKLIAAMMTYNKELADAGVLLALDGLQPTAKGARIRFSSGKASVTEGPFPDAKDVLGGYWMNPGELEGRSDQLGLALSGAGGRDDRNPPGVRGGRFRSGGGARGGCAARSDRQAPRPEHRGGKVVIAMSPTACETA
jgi:hypothetical protein